MSSQEVGARGVNAVAEHVKQRGAIAEPVTEGRSRNYLSVVTPSGRRSTVYVKTKRMGDWQSDIRKGTPREPVGDEHRFWILVDLAAPAAPKFHVVPEWWMENNIYNRHREWIAQHGGIRPRAPKSTHHGIQPWRVEQWYNRWDLLGL
jgi:hypothetical protein